MEKYVLDAMFMVDYDDEALFRMKERYTDMVEDNDRDANTCTLSLTSPADAVASVGVPRFEGKNTTVAIDNTVIFEDGKPTGKVNGVEYLTDDENYIYFNVTPAAIPSQGNLKEDAE